MVVEEIVTKLNQNDYFMIIILENDNFRKRIQDFYIEHEEAFNEKKEEIIRNKVDKKYNDYNGIRMIEINNVEKHFKKPINILEINDKSTCSIVRLSKYEWGTSIPSVWLNLYLNHFSFISNV